LPSKLTISIPIDELFKSESLPHVLTPACQLRLALETAPNDEIGKEKLIEYGYHIDKHIKDLKQYKFVVAAFQRHFRPSGVDSIMDVETYAILLPRKYKIKSRKSEGFLGCFI
jgi:N-acetyl-anhydromuramyl-L-alanine amidase AmpD